MIQTFAAGISQTAQDSCVPVFCMKEICKRSAISFQSSARQKNTAAFTQLLSRGRVIMVRLPLFSLKADS
jgi:hypothetical protein